MIPTCCLGLIITSQQIAHCEHKIKCMGDEISTAYLQNAVDNQYGDQKMNGVVTCLMNQLVLKINYKIQ